MGASFFLRGARFLGVSAEEVFFSDFEALGAGSSATWIRRAELSDRTS